MGILNGSSGHWPPFDFVKYDDMFVYVKKNNTIITEIVEFDEKKLIFDLI